MINHGYAPAIFLQSNMVPIPKGARANVTDSNMYRNIAISSIMSKILDNVIIEQQQLSLSTSSYQFGFKSKASTALCTTMMVENIQYYLEKGDNSVCLLLLDSSKAFDKVSLRCYLNYYPGCYIYYPLMYNYFCTIFQLDIVKIPVHCIALLSIS